MQTIRIILSAGKTLEQERKELADMVENLNHSLERRDANILMLVWDGTGAAPDSFKENISDKDLCLTLYYDTFDDSAESELETAYRSLCEGKNPKKIYVYFKDSETVPEKLKAFRDSFPTKYGHFYCSFSNIDTLKADFLLQFMEYQSKSLGSSKMLEVSNGKVTIDGRQYVDLKNVPFAGNNEEYNLLLKSIKKTQKLLSITEPDDPDYTEYANELSEMQDKLSKMESSLWDTALMITRLSTTKCSERLKRAMDLFTSGDNKGAQAILKEEDIDKDIEHNLSLIRLGDEGKKGLRVNIDEIKLKICILGTEMPDGWLQEQCRLHKRVIELTTALYGENSLEAAQTMMDSAEALYLLEEHHTLYDFIKKALNIRLQLLGENNLETARCFNDLGVVVGKLGNCQEYLDYASKGLEIRLALNAPDELLAESYNTTGVAISHFGDKEKSLEYQKKGLELRKRAFGEMNLNTANSYSQVGSAYGEMGNNEMYLKYSLRALEITETTVGDKHPDTALFHNNVAVAYMGLGNFSEAIPYLKKSLDIEISTKGKFTKGAYVSFVNLLISYKEIGDLKKALDCIMEAIEISECINGKIHQETLNLYEHAGAMLDDFGDKKLSLDYLYHALDIRFETAKQQTSQTVQRLAANLLSYAKSFL